MTPVVSILMAVYNAEVWLQAALDSVVQQTMGEWELLAVDDASTDGSLAILQEYAQRDNRIRVFHHDENKGLAHARNTALHQVRGEFVMMLDADDWLSPDALQNAIDVFHDHPLTDCALFRLVYEWQETCNSEDFHMRLPKQSSGKANDIVLAGTDAFLLSLDWSIHGLYLVRNEVHKDLPFDTHYRLYSDDNTSRVVFLRCREVRLCQGIYHYRRHQASVTMQFSSQRFLHMMANLDLRETLKKVGVSEDIVARYDKHRWHNYLGLLWLYFRHRSDMNKKECARVREDFRYVYTSFHRSMPYAFFVVNQWVRYKIKSFIKRL